MKLQHNTSMQRMPKKQRRILIWSVLGILILLFIVLPRPKKIDVDAEPGQKAAAIPTVEKATIAEEGKNPPYVIDIEYPKLVGTDDPAIAEAVNKSIALELDAAVRDLKQNMDWPPEEIKDVKNGLTIRYEVAYVNPNILSVALNESEYIAGAAHPQNLISTLNYDLRTGKRVRLADLFTKGSDYLKRLSDYAIPELAKQLEVPAEDKDRMDEITSGAAPRPDNYQEFLIAKEGLVVVFNTYQVGPYAIGAPRVAVPYALLQPITDPTGILPLRGTPGI